MIIEQCTENGKMNDGHQDLCAPAVNHVLFWPPCAFEFMLTNVLQCYSLASTFDLSIGSANVHVVVRAVLVGVGSVDSVAMWYGGFVPPTLLFLHREPLS